MEESEKDLTLLAFLSTRLGLSRKKAKRLLDTRNLFIHGRRVWMARHKLRPGDTVDVPDPKSTRRTKTPIKVLFEDDHCLVVNKPAGVLSNGSDSAEERLRDELQLPDLAVAHRIDRDTSGCLLVAATQQALDALVGSFRRHEVQKQYHVIVRGRLDTSNRTISSPIDGRRAVTNIRTLDGNRDASHLLVRTETGRTHQIRKHLDSLGHAVLGDRLYGLRPRSGPRKTRIGRQMLHASHLSFRHADTGRLVSVSAPLPHDFRSCLRVFRLS